jgi:peptidoglycan/LPS O-acetylase OafA/YrhL
MEPAAMVDSPRDNSVGVPRAVAGGRVAAAGGQPGHFVLLDALRGLGALGIACYHIHRYRPLEIPADHLLPFSIQYVVRHGWISVQVFWVIAGFVAAYSLRQTAVTPVAVGRFTLRRILRLGIPYWTAILAVVAIDLGVRQWLDYPAPPSVPSVQQSPEARRAALIEDYPVGCRRLAANLAFLQDVLGYDNLSAGTWFVCVDLQLGLLFAVLLGVAQWSSPAAARIGDRLISRPRKGQTHLSPDRPHPLALTAVFVPLGLLSLLVFHVRTLDDWIVYYFYMPLLGALAWWAIEGRIPRCVFWIYAAAVAGAATSHWLSAIHRWHDAVHRWQDMVHRLQELDPRWPGTALHWPIDLLKDQKPLGMTVALAAGVTIYLAGRRGHLGNWLGAGWLQYLGRISYSLFLIHYPASWCVVSFGRYWSGDNPTAAVVWLLLALAASIVAAHFFYEFVEAPSVRLIRRLR